MEKIERELQELESASSHTASKFSSLNSPANRRCLILLNDSKQLPQSLQWIQSHGLNLNELILVVKQAEDTASPLVFKLESEQIVPPFLSSFVNNIRNSIFNPTEVTIYALPSLQLASTTTSLLRDKKIDLVLIVGCHSLTRGQYETISQQPFIEEIILKQAIQPVILFK